MHRNPTTRNPFLATLFAAILGAATALAAAHALAGPVKRVVPKGKDGDNLYYQVMCQDGTKGSVIVQGKENTVCAQALGGELVCDAGWSIQRAAEHACN